MNKIQFTIGHSLCVVHCALCIIILLSSCSKKKIEIPLGILAKEQMVPVLVDVHIAQAASSLYNTSDTVRYTMNDYLSEILKIHHLSKLQYDSSVAFYLGHPELMEQIYDSVITELSKKQGEVTAH